MIRYRGAVAGAASLALILGAVTAADSPTLAATRAGGGCTAGAHTLAPPGSRLYPETGNGGYTSVHTYVQAWSTTPPATASCPATTSR